MEPTEPGADGLGAGSGPVRAPASSGRHPARVAVASVGAIVLVAAAIGVISATGNGRARPPLVLHPAGNPPAKESPAVADDSGGIALSAPYRYRLAVTAPDLGADAPVARLEAPTADDGRIAAMAAALGLHGDVTGVAGGSRQVTEGSARLTVDPVPGGWAVSYGLDGGISSPGSVSPSGGASGASEASPESTIDPSVTASTVKEGPPVTEGPAVNLPEPAEAERIARSLLDRMAITGDWSATTIDTASEGAACAPEPCAIPDHVVVTTRVVELKPRLAGVAVDGLSWQITVGNNGDVVGVFGTWTTLRTLDRYPLRTVASVFADLEAGKGTSSFPEPMNTRELGAPTPADATRPITVTIDRVALGFTVIPASDNGVEVVDVVPTYGFRGTTSGGGEFTQVLIAVEATVVPPPVTTTPPTKPIDGGPPSGRPEPQPAPVPEPTVSGKPPT